MKDNTVTAYNGVEVLALSMLGIIILIVDIIMSL